MKVSFPIWYHFGTILALLLHFPPDCVIVTKVEMPVNTA